MTMSKTIFGIDIGGTTIKCGVFDGDAELVIKEEIPTRTQENGRYILADIAQYINKIIEKNALQVSDILGIGIGIPGAIRNDGAVNKCVNLGWGEVYVADELSAMINVSKDCIHIANDANVAALGEFFKGSGKGYHSIMMLTIGTGIGGGFILDGHIVNGFHGAAAEIGHLPVVEGLDYACSCGNTGCLEQVASASGIARLAGTNNAKEAFDKAIAGDKAMNAVIENVSKYLAKGMACIAGVVDPECFIIGGGVSAAGEYFLEKIRKYYQMFAFHASKDTTIIKALLENDAGIYGAAKLVLGDLQSVHGESEND